MSAQGGCRLRATAPTGEGGPSDRIFLVEDAVANKNADEAKVALNDATKLIDSACSKGVYHKNNAARKVSRLAQLVNTIA